MVTQLDQKDVEKMMQKLKASWGWLIAFGIISLIGGFLCFSNPLAATITADYLAAFFFILLGVAQIVQAFSIREWGGFLWTIAVGLLTLLVGAVLIGNPVAGAASLTVLVGILMFLLGGAKIAYAISLRPVSGWVWVMASGFLSVVLGIIIFANFPWAAAAVLGLFLGVELTFNGVTLLMTGFALRNH
jgi:uncharacterized membrane protein HdeD (DUF308 family)